jgi:hypothetical protein
MKRSPLRRVSVRGTFSEARCKRLDDKLRAKLRDLTHNRCEECGQSIQGFDSQLSHGITRKVKSLRWDRLNVCLSCAACHFKRQNYPHTVHDTLTRLLGLAGYMELQRRSCHFVQVKRLSYEAIEAYIDRLTAGKYPTVSPVPLWEL